jgi:putative cardiolipin synthase
VTDNVFEAIRGAKRVASSPYFVPGPNSLEMLHELRSRGVKVTVKTKSLASTDEPVVHIGYAAHREELPGMGVDLY